MYRKPWGRKKEKIPKPAYLSDPRVIALRTALQDSIPFCSGTCAIPHHQRFLYYKDVNALRCIDFSNARADDLDALYRACKPAEFGRGNENIFDESYRKAGKMDLSSFATLFDPRSVGIHEKVWKSLLTGGHATMETELYKLNVYGPGDFFKAHQDTPRGQNMFGSLVVVFPTLHEGGQLVLRQDEREWSFDFAEKIATAPEPSVCFLAFYGDVEHEVLPVTSGHRVTLTYNLYQEPVYPSPSPILAPLQFDIKQALISLVTDDSVLPNGGYLGFGLAHEYVHQGRNLVGLLLGQLKGADRALADACDALGLRYSLRLFYRRFGDEDLDILTTTELDMLPLMDDMEESSPLTYLERALNDMSIEEAEVVALVGKHQPDPDLLKYKSFLESFHRNPITEVLEITRMKSSVDIKSPISTYGNQMTLGYVYGTACMLVAVEPAGSRHLIGV